MQTLHLQHFDQGTILAQTPHPGFEHECSTVPELLTLMSSKGSEMLVQSISNRLYLQSAKSPEIPQGQGKLATARAAPKITSQDKFIDWNTWTAEVIIRRHLVIGPLWSFVKNGENVRRLIWTTGFSMSEEAATCTDIPVGRLVLPANEDCGDGRGAYVRTCDDRVLKVDRIKIAGGEESWPLRAAQKADMIDHSIRCQNISILLSKDWFASD